MTTPDGQEQQPQAQQQQQQQQQGQGKQQNPHPKKPKLTKAERRALQEKQRAAKLARQGGGEGGKGKQQQQQQQKRKKGGKTSEGEGGEEGTKQSNSNSNQPVSDPASKKVAFLSHLPPYRDPRDYPKEFLSVLLHDSTSTLPHAHHSAVLELGLQYALGTIRGGNQRCRAMLQCFQTIWQDYQPPPEGDVRHHLQNMVLKPSFQYWTESCRPHSVSMGNAFSFVKQAVASLDRDMEWSDMHQVLNESVDAYIRERIDFADQVIAQIASSKIVDGDVILTYSHFEVIEILLKHAACESENKPSFRVIIVDSKPLLGGKQLVRELQKNGIECTYVLMNALSYVIGEATKVFLGASALLSDGSVMSRVGTACVALAAHAKKIPVLVCGETYKICNRTQLESISHNEMGNPHDILDPSLNEHDDNLCVINLLYDLTPATFVSGVVTEMGILPPSSVAVLLHEMNPNNEPS